MFLLHITHIIYIIIHTQVELQKLVLDNHSKLTTLGEAKLQCNIILKYI